MAQLCGSLLAEWMKAVEDLDRFTCNGGCATVGMTLRYAHLADPDIETAAERTGQAMARLIGP